MSVVKSVASILAGAVVTAVAHVAGLFLVFGNQVPMFWSLGQRVGYAVSMSVASLLGAYLAARLAPRAPITHALPVMLVALYAADGQWAPGRSPWPPLVLLLGALIGVGIGARLGAAPGRSSSRSHLTNVEADERLRG